MDGPQCMGTKGISVRPPPHTTPAAVLLAAGPYPHMEACTTERTISHPLCSQPPPRTTPAAVLLEAGSYAHMEACTIERTISHGLEMLRGSRAHLRLCEFFSCTGSAVLAFESGGCGPAAPVRNVAVVIYKRILRPACCYSLLSRSLVVMVGSMFPL